VQNRNPNLLAAPATHSHLSLVKIGKLTMAAYYANLLAFYGRLTRMQIATVSAERQSTAIQSYQSSNMHFSRQCSHDAQAVLTR